MTNRIKVSKLQKFKNDEYSKYWRNKADKVFSEILRLIYGVCIYCGRTEMLDCCHLIPRENYPTRWEFSNAIILCKKHHKFSFEFSFHKNPALFFVWLNENYNEIFNTIKPNSVNGGVRRTYKESYELLSKIRGRFQ